MTQMSPDGGNFSTAARSLTTTAPGSVFSPGASVRETTTLRRRGSGRPSDSHVFRPITTVCPVVCSLKNFKSSGNRHGIFPPAPMTRFSPSAAMAFQVISVAIFLHRNRRFDARMRVVFEQFNVLKFEILQIFDRRVEPHARQRLAARAPVAFPPVRDG